MTFLKFLEKKTKKGKSSASFGINREGLPGLPPLHPDAPSELEDPFNKDKKFDDHNLDIGRDKEEDFESLPPLPSLDEINDKDMKKKSINKINTTHTKEIEEFEFPDMSEAPEFDEEFDEEIKEKSIDNKEGPLFVNISGFKEILSDINDIKKDLKEGNEILDSVLEMKDRQDHRFIKWSEELQEIESKLMYVDKKLFETKYY